MSAQSTDPAERTGIKVEIVVVLLVLVMPILIFQVRHYRKEQAR